MTPIRVLTWFILAIAALLSIIALFLNIAAPIGLDKSQQKRLITLYTKNKEQCNETELLLESLADVNETLEHTTVDTLNRLPALERCESYVRERTPALMNASEVRLMELLEFNETVAPRLELLLPGLSAAQTELNVLERTGIIKTHQSGVVNIFQYAINSIALWDNSELYYINLPKTPGLIEVMNNVSDVLLTDWNPPIAASVPREAFTRVDSILDRQQEKVMSVPNPIMFTSRTYPNGTDILLSGSIVLMMGDFIGISDAVHIG